MTALVPNLQGAAAAMKADVDTIAIPISVSDAHSMANVRRTPIEMVAQLAEIRRLRDSAGNDAYRRGARDGLRLHHPGRRSRGRGCSCCRSLQTGGTGKTPTLPITVDGKRLQFRSDPPKVGANTGRLLQGLPFGTGGIQALFADGVVGREPPAPTRAPQQPAMRAEYLA